MPETNVSAVDHWSLAHMSSGMVVFYSLFALLGKKEWWFLVVCVLLGFAWELLENNPWFQAKLRSWGFPEYYGDSGRNMIADQVSAIVGFAMAWYGPRWFMLLPALSEVLVYFLVRDNVTLAVFRALKTG